MVDLSSVVQVAELKTGCLLNQTLMMQKLAMWGESIAPCNAVLKEDPTNTKALYRRGISEMNFGDPTLEPRSCNQ